MVINVSRNDVPWKVKVQNRESKSQKQAPAARPKSKALSCIFMITSLSEATDRPRMLRKHASLPQICGTYAVLIMKEH